MRKSGHPNLTDILNLRLVGAVEAIGICKKRLWYFPSYVVVN